MTPLKGIDVSNNNGASFDWEAEAAQGVHFAFIKATEGIDFADEDFARNWHEAKQRGLVRGAYHFFHPEEPVEQQASWFLSHVHAQGVEPGDLLMLDHEQTGGLNPEAAAAAAEHFVAIVNSSEHASTVVYIDEAMADGGYCKGLGGSPLFLARPGVTVAPAPPPWKLVSFLQYAQRGVDQDLGYFDSVDQLRKLGVRAAQQSIDQALEEAKTAEADAAAAEAAQDELEAAHPHPHHKLAGELQSLANSLRSVAEKLLAG